MSRAYVAALQKRNEKKDRVLYYIISILVYNSKCWTIPSHLKTSFEGTEMWLYGRMLTISWAKYVSKTEVLRKMDPKRALLENQKDLVEISGIHQEERGPGEFDTHRSLSLSLWLLLIRTYSWYYFGHVIEI